MLPRFLVTRVTVSSCVCAFASIQIARWTTIFTDPPSFLIAGPTLNVLLCRTLPFRLATRNSIVTRNIIVVCYRLPHFNYIISRPIGQFRVCFSLQGGRERDTSFFLSLFISFDKIFTASFFIHRVYYRPSSSSFLLLLLLLFLLLLLSLGTK